MPDQSSVQHQSAAAGTWARDNFAALFASYRVAEISTFDAILRIELSSGLSGIVLRSIHDSDDWSPRSPGVDNTHVNMGMKHPLTPSKCPRVIFTTQSVPALACVWSLMSSLQKNRTAARAVKWRRSLMTAHLLIESYICARILSPHSV